MIYLFTNLSIYFRDKQINQLREQRDRAEKEVKEEKVIQIRGSSKLVNYRHFKIIRNKNIFRQYFLSITKCVGGLIIIFPTESRILLLEHK